MIRKTKSSRFEVAVYNPAIAKKVYVGTYAKRGSVNEPGTARHAEAQAERRFAGRGRIYAGTVAAVVQWWLGEHPRPEATTNRHNANNLKMLLADGVALPKTKETREIILPAAAAEAVRGMPTQGIEWLFTTSSGQPFGKGSWNYYWRPVRDAFTRELPTSHWLAQRLAVDPKAKLEIYELRHFCGSLLADRGATARDIAEQLGNTAQVCERTYIHAYQNRVRARLRAAFDQPEAPESADQLTRRKQR